MRRICIRSRKGFTLLEVLLAVVILVIASSMIMTGVISIMTFANNNSRYAASGAHTEGLANTAVAQFATSSSQMNTIYTLANNGNAHVLSAEYNPAYAAPVTLPNLVVDVMGMSGQNSVFNSQDGSEISINGETIDEQTYSTNRFSFFYDYGDFLGAASTGGHIIRWGFLYSKTPQTGYEPIYVDKNGNGRVGADDAAAIATERVGYGLYGWYCFNADHVQADGTTPQSCRTTRQNPTHYTY